MEQCSDLEGMGLGAAVTAVEQVESGFQPLDLSGLNSAVDEQSTGAGTASGKEIGNYRFVEKTAWWSKMIDIFCQCLHYCYYITKNVI